MSGEPLGVVIVEDHTIVRQGLVSLLDARDEFRVAGECGTAAEAVALVRAAAPALVVLDLSLPDGSGLEVIGALRRACPTCKIVVLTMHDQPQYVLPALRAGVAGYLVKGAGIGDLVQALRCAVRGELFLSPGIARLVVETPPPEGLDVLTGRETEVLGLVARGKTSREIGALLGISPKTVDNHRQNIMHKLGVHDVVSLTRLSIRSGLISAD